MNHKLTEDYYLARDVVKIARDLLGKALVTNIGGVVSSGIIVETEAYNGIFDRASHAYNNRRTKRNEVMYAQGGVAYIYLCYGMHHLFNVVTNRSDVPDAVLIRALLPTEGIAIMLKRRGKKEINGRFSDGPGTASQALGITIQYSGEPLTGNKIWIEERNIKIGAGEIGANPRIGVDYAGKDALLPYRFRLKELSIERLKNECA